MSIVCKRNLLPIMFIGQKCIGLLAFLVYISDEMHRLISRLINHIKASGRSSLRREDMLCLQEKTYPMKFP